MLQNAPAVKSNTKGSPMATPTMKEAWMYRCIYPFDEAYARQFCCSSAADFLAMPRLNVYSTLLNMVRLCSLLESGMSVPQKEVKAI